MMLNFDFTKEQNEFARSVRQFAEKEIAPYSAYWDKHEEFPWDAVRKMAQIGLLGLAYPKRLGGQAKSYVHLGIAVNEVARSDYSCALILAGQNTGSLPAFNWGEDLLRAVIAGEKIICVASTEPGMGSDLTAIKTVARREGDEYIINGVKRYISLVPAAYGMAVFCRIASPTAGHKASGISLIRVEPDRPGVSITEIHEFGMRAHKWGNIVLKDVRVPVSNLVAEDGIHAAERGWELMRTLNTLGPIGAAEISIEETIEYAKRRDVFGKPLGRFEAILFRIVDDYINLQMAKLMAFKALWLLDQGRSAMEASAVAKAFGPVVACRAIDSAMQIHGALGYSTDLPLEQRYRDARAGLFMSGSIEMMKIILGRELLGDRRYCGF